MKAEHRHELKTNVLAEWLINSPQWTKENLRTIIIVSIVAVTVIASSSAYWYRKNIESVQRQLELTKLIGSLPHNKMQIIQAHAQGVDISYMLIQTANNLKSVAENIKDDAMAAFALIKQAETLRMELHYRPGTASKQDATAQINRAKASYTEAIGKSSSNPSLMAAAEFGLGLCEEEIGNFDQAGRIYSAIIENPDFECTTATVQAKQRLNTIADYQQKVVFKATPKPEPAETELLQPQIQLTAPDINLPGQ